MIDYVDADGATPLVWAAQRGDSVMVDALIRYGAEVSTASHSGATALYYAGDSTRPGALACLQSY